MYTASSTDIEITQVTVDLDFTSIDLVEILPMEQSFEVTFQEASRFTNILSHVEYLSEQMIHFTGICR